jgi:hypothetical protein
VRKAGTTLLVLCVAGGAGWLVAPSASAGPGSAAFEPRQIGLAIPLLFDLGVADFDGDDDLDVFTVNHNERQSLLANQGDGGFVDRLSSVGLDQLPQFPGFEVPAAPNTAGNGVDLYRTPGSDPVEGALRVAVRTDPGDEVNGIVEFRFPVAVNRDDGADVSIDVDATRTPPVYSVHFTAGENALIELEPEQMAAPVALWIDDAVPLSAIHVGPLGVSPTAHRFTLYLRDRHGMAWADYNRDGRIDAFIARGGLKRRVGEFGGLILDELMLGDGSRFHDAIASSGILKGACRGREVSPVDVNRDGLLDVFYGCQGSHPALWLQNADGTFTNGSAQLVRGGVGGDHFKWLDLNGDGREELLASRGHKLLVFRRSPGGRWSKRQALRTSGPPRSRVTTADFDRDRDPDVFVASPKGNTLLINREGELRVRARRRFGLPKSGSFTASWVDYDNDGRTDLYAAPQGLFHGVGNRFRATGIANSAPTTNETLATWFDFNGDGARDLLRYHSDKAPHATLLENLEHRNHWLEVELVGPHGAYPALGASVRVRIERRGQTQWVGQNEGSRYSQGHYRLYYGLGDANHADLVTVTWPNGSIQRLRDVPADQLLHVSFDGR